MEFEVSEAAEEVMFEAVVKTGYLLVVTDCNSRNAETDSPPCKK